MNIKTYNCLINVKNTKHPVLLCLDVHPKLTNKYHHFRGLVIDILFDRIIIQRLLDGKKFNIKFSRIGDDFVIMDKIRKDLPS